MINGKRLSAGGSVGYNYQQDDDGYFDDSRRSQLYWTTDATKALIKLRGEREAEFEQAGASKSLLWIEICKQMREMGYDFTAEKVSKKWHNIMITYNKNIRKKIETGIVNWGFFEDIDMYLKMKREQNQSVDDYTSSESQSTMPTNSVPMLSIPTAAPTVPHITAKRKFNDDQEEDSSFYDMRR